MQKQTFHYTGENALDIVDMIADKLDALPYESMYSQYEGQEEVFFYSVTNAFDEEYQTFVTSALSFCIQSACIRAEVISTAPQTDMGMENLALKKQMIFWQDFFQQCHFHEHVHHEGHVHHH